MDFLDTKANVNQQKEIVSDISTDSEDNLGELPGPVESGTSLNTKAPRVLTRSQMPKSLPTIFG